MLSELYSIAGGTTQPGLTYGLTGRVESRSPIFHLSTRVGFLSSSLGVSGGRKTMLCRRPIPNKDSLSHPTDSRGGPAEVGGHVENIGWY